ncbi:hypothetical protein Tco_0157164 [Tanacetum coccineum]
MSTSNTHQQSLADAGSETRPPMFERGSYIPWASRFRRYLNQKRENRKCLNKAIDEGPYVFKNYTPPESQTPRMQTEDVLTGDDLKHYEAEIEAINLILISILNEIYNFVDACTIAKAMETRFNNEFDQFVAEPGEALVSIYNRFARLMNDLERNGIRFPLVTVNTKFLNCLQPEWLKYVTEVCLAKRLTQDTYDDLFNYLQQFEKLVNTSRAKKLEKSHDPLALVAHTGSSSRTSSPYYVTHPSSVVDYGDDYQGDAFKNNSEDPLTSAMMLLARAITQHFSNLINNHLRTSSNTRNQAIVQADRVNIQSRSSGNDGRDTRRYMFKRKSLRVPMIRMMLGTHRELFELRLQDLLQMFNATIAVRNVIMLVIVQSQEFKIQSTSWNRYIEELSANICLMARIQQANIDSDAGPSYDSAFLSEFLQNILDLYFKHFKLSEDVVNRILQVVLDLQHFKSSLFIFAATILQSSSAIHHISNIDNYVHQIIKFQSILITSSHSLWSSQSFGHQKGVCPWLTENHFNSQYLKHWASQSFGT